MRSEKRAISATRRLCYATLDYSGSARASARIRFARACEKIDGDLREEIELTTQMAYGLRYSGVMID